MLKKITAAAALASFALLAACKDDAPLPPPDTVVDTTVDTSVPPDKEPRDPCGPGKPPLKDGVKCP